MSYLYEFPELSRGVIRTIKKSIDASFREFSRTYGDSIEIFFYPLKVLMNWVEFTLVSAPWPLTMLCIVGAIFYLTRDKKLCIGTIVYMIFIGAFGLWEDTMYTLSLVLVSGILSVAMGVPIGIWMSRSDRVQKFINPILDIMR